MTAVPTEDQRRALSLYCELSIQKGSLTNVLDIVLLLWDLWHAADSENTAKGLTSAPLVPLVRRFEVKFIAVSHSLFTCYHSYHGYFSCKTRIL